MESTEALLDRVNRLPEFERSLLQLLSIIYEPAHTTLIVNCLRKLELKGPRGNRPTTTGIAHHINKLQDSGFISDNQQCGPALVESISRRAVSDGTFARFAEVVRQEAPVSYYYGKWTTRCWRAMRELRIGIYCQDFDTVEQAIAFLDNQCSQTLTDSPPAVHVVTSQFERSWFRTLPPSFQFFLLNLVLRHAQQQLAAYPAVLAYLEDESEFGQLDEDERLPFIRLLLNHYLLSGRIECAEAFLTNHAELFVGTGARGTTAFLKGDFKQAAELYAHDKEQLQRISGTEDVVFVGLHGLFHVLANIVQYERADFYLISRQISISLSLFEGSEESESYLFLANLLDGLLSQHGGGELIRLSEKNSPHSLSVLFCALVQFWLDGSLDPAIEREVESFYERSLDGGYHLFSISFGDLLARVLREAEPYRTSAEDLSATTGLKSFLDVIEPEETWKRSLQALVNISTSAVQEYTNLDARLVWLVNHNKGRVSVRPREQKRTQSGDWSRGRPVSLARLHGAGDFQSLTLKDRKICLAIVKEESKDGQPAYSFDREKLVSALIGHPSLFLEESPGTPVEFVTGEPELFVQEQGENLHINFSISVNDENIALVRETPTRFKVIRIAENHRKIARITGHHGLTVPTHASEQVLAAIGNISSFMTVHSAIAADTTALQSPDISQVEADPTTYMHMLPYGSGFRLEMFVKPFRDGSHYLKPGQGVENIMAEVGGKRLQTRRDLFEEEKRAREVEEMCPILDLAMDLEQGNDREWHLYDPDDCLQALLELQDISDRVVIEWPEGEKLNIAHRASFKNLNLKIRTNRQNWFSISGELVLDQERVIDLKELLSRVNETPGRFVQLSDGQFIALTQEFRKRLEELSTFASETADTNNPEIVIHPLAALPLEKLTDQANTRADKTWRNQLAAIQQNQSFAPDVPSTLQAELRDYQIEGYHWLSRLAQWGVGGCLADDMGLGKTLQSLAIILQRAANGPSLVVAPTSVSTNWLTEVRRFTPTLSIKQLTARERNKTISELGKFDLLITTYTLLQQEKDQLAQVDWQTIVLDEAQAIKNAATKRSQAAMALQGGFRLITTGTPIENHLGELWNLFNFINPGLLGTHKQFNERFAIPIERFNNRDARMRLKKLIRPFILRRIKSQVLEELPPRTEVTLEVTMNEEEMHFYEALRQNALDLLEGSTDNRGRHLQILTEIMKLRQACCNPRLIAKDTRIVSSKLDVFAALIDELIAGRHKVLVFSQFIGHLNIIREHLDGKQITYQYLDGSTSSRHRKERVEAFQAGLGDLFLISLKAGGLGLNLTAADYVIHMDPWWNPAIEDQASDRAHRIGQTRPVTIYRLVCKNTIEEKIVTLHQEKRDLADSLLEGTDMSARLNSDELLDLIREN
jgi:SNF2 family DNA or RNA helicase